jgi:hypothetical protein
VTVTFIVESIGAGVAGLGRAVSLVGKEGVEPSRPFRGTGS